MHGEAGSLHGANMNFTGIAPRFFENHLVPLVGKRERDIFAPLRGDDAAAVEIIVKARQLQTRAVCIVVRNQNIFAVFGHIQCFELQLVYHFFQRERKFPCYFFQRHNYDLSGAIYSNINLHIIIITHYVKYFKYFYVGLWILPCLFYGDLSEMKKIS